MKQYVLIVSAVLLFACALSSSAMAALVNVSLGNQIVDGAESALTYVGQNDESSLPVPAFSPSEYQFDPGADGSVTSLGLNTPSSSSDKQDAGFTQANNSNNFGHQSEWFQWGYVFRWKNEWNFHWYGKWNEHGECEPSSAVPIPNAVWLLGSGLLGLIVIRNRTS